MSSFDWQKFLISYNVPFATKGANVGRQHISVRCPWCGDADPSQHLTIDLRGYGWRCYRNPAHRGKSRSRLIQALLRCSGERARELAGEYRPPLPDDENLVSQVASMLGVVSDTDTASEPLELLPEFKPVLSRSSLSEPFWDYLEDRGYTSREIVWLAQNYKLHYATRGPYRYRLIVPVYDFSGALVTWTGRSIVKDAEVRYKTLPVTGEGLVARAAPGSLLLGANLLRDCVNARALVICEGPFDALRISASGWREGVYGTCLFGLNVSDGQIDQLLSLSVQFPNMYLCLDENAQMVTMRILDRLSVVNCQVVTLPDGVDDPGDLGPKAPEFIHKLAA